MKSASLLSVLFATSIQASTFTCDLDLHQFEDAKPSVPACDHAFCLPFLAGTIESIDTDMPQRHFASYVLKHVKGEGREIFRATAESLWHDNKKAVFDTSKLTEVPGIEMKVVFPLDINQLKSGQKFNGLFSAHSPKHAHVTQYIPLACAIS